MAFFTEFFPSKNDYRPFKKNFRYDLIAGITVGVVALPLALGFGITTGSGAASVLAIDLIWGLVIGLLTHLVLKKLLPRRG